MGIMETLPSWAIVAYCLDLHFPCWDTLGREESSIARDIEAQASQFCLVELELSLLQEIDDPPVEIDDSKIRRFRLLIAKSGGAENVPPPVLNRELEPIDGWHRSIAMKEEGILSHQFWIPETVCL
jgi:hypothetical protein